MSAADPSIDPSTSVEKHRRETRLSIWLPFGLAVLVIVVCAIIMMSPLFSPPEGQYQVSTVANILLMVFILCPSVICFGALAIGMVIAVFAMNKGHTALEKPLRRVEDFSKEIEQRTQQTTHSINRKTIELSSRFAILNKWLDVFNKRPKGEK